MAYNSIENSEISTDSPITTGLMTKIRDNNVAMKDGTGIDNDAILNRHLATNSVNQDSIAAGAVHQGELDTSTASGSTSITKQATGTVALTGGTYSWWTAGADGDTMWFGAGNTAAGTIGLYNNAGGIGSSSFYRDERYINASPPYDLGDGEIPLFIFAMIEPNSKIKSIEVAPDPTWAYHGETCIIPHRIDRKTGKKYRTVKACKSTGNFIKDERKANPKLWLDVLSERDAIIDREIEITTDFKNSDIDTHPHPWVYNSPDFFNGSTIVMLNPYGKPMEKLRQIYEAGGSREVMNLIMEGYVNISGSTLAGVTPEGVSLHDFGFKNAGA